MGIENERQRTSSMQDCLWLAYPLPFRHNLLTMCSSLAKAVAVWTVRSCHSLSCRNWLLLSSLESVSCPSFQEGRKEEEEDYRPCHLLCYRWDSRICQFLCNPYSSGASFVFLFLLFHLGRAISYGSYFYNPNSWFSGILLFFFLMTTAFIGYVLPFGQMSFWGATVITNLLSPFPSLIE